MFYRDIKSLMLKISLCYFYLSPRSLKRKMASKSKTLKKIKGKVGEDTFEPTYGRRYFDSTVPRNEIPEGDMSPDAAYQIISDELNLDGNTTLNLASFVTTWMDPQARQLYLDTLNKNFIDFDEYPQTETIHNRVVEMTWKLLNGPKGCIPTGTATIGSSEAIMLGLLAHKWKWKEHMKAKGKDCSKPNIVMGADVHTCWEKFAKYFDVEMKLIPMEVGRYVIGPKEVAPLLDENTIAVGAILGTTFTGQIDDIAGINKLLLKVKKEKGWDIPIHVDGASGGFIAPFVYPEVKWDFRLEQVKSINVSNHKFGLVYPGMGTVVFRDKVDLPEELIFKINYLGGEMENYSLNFSRGASTVLLQYYNYLRLGKKGYRDIMNNIMENAKYLEAALVKTKHFKILNAAKYLPVVAVTLTGKRDYTVFDVSEKLRERGWIVPAYTLPANAEKIAVLRMVVKENFSRDMGELLIADIKRAIAKLEGTYERKPLHNRNKRRAC